MKLSISCISEVVFQHIPSKIIVEQYVREAARVLKPSSVFKFHVQGHAIPETEAGTWVGVGFSEDEMHAMASQAGFQVRAAEGAGTQYFWLTFVKTPDIYNAFRPPE